MLTKTKTSPICSGAFHVAMLVQQWRALQEFEARTFGHVCEASGCQNGHAKYGVGGFLCESCLAKFRLKDDERLMHEPEESE